MKWENPGPGLNLQYRNPLWSLPILSLPEANGRMFQLFNGPILLGRFPYLLMWSRRGVRTGDNKFGNNDSGII